MANFIQLIADRKESIAKHTIFQKSYLFYALLRYWHLSRWRNDIYGAYAVTLKYERIAASVSGWKASSTIRRINSRLVTDIKRNKGKNVLLNSYVTSIAANQYRDEFRKYGWEHQIRLKYPREHDGPFRQGDLLLLKPYMNDREKGVIFIQYNDAFDKFVSIYDLTQVATFYRIVLEPSTWGYCDPSILFFLSAGTDVIVQAQHASDFEYIRSLDTNLTPLRMGAGDWIDPDRFQTRPVSEKVYDIVMVASWQRIKRHELLFRAIGKCGSKVKKIALIGYPSEGRTREDVLREADKYAIAEKIDIYESISRAEVGTLIGQSRIGVMLTLREGANKGIYECFFSGVPVVISSENIGVNRDHINQHTGIAAADHDLDQKMLYLLSNLHNYAPREWALKNTGYKNSSQLLNKCLRECAIRMGEEWTKDIFAKKNDTYAQYILDDDRMEADRAIVHLGRLLRQ